MLLQRSQQNRLKIQGKLEELILFTLLKWETDAAACVLQTAASAHVLTLGNLRLPRRYFSFGFSSSGESLVNMFTAGADLAKRSVITCGSTVMAGLKSSPDIYSSMALRI